MANKRVGGSTWGSVPVLRKRRRRRRPRELYTIDENGNGMLNGTTALPFALQADPGPGGLSSVLTYSLLVPTATTAGDVLLQEGVGGPILDIIRFNNGEVCPGGNAAGCLVFYSDNVDGFDALADTPGPPSLLYANTVTIVELGPEGNNGVTYTPLPGQPGYTGTGAVAVYNLISDSVAVPAPLIGHGLFVLLAIGGVLFGAKLLEGSKRYTAA
jgi:hypothetical protein